MARLDLGASTGGTTQSLVWAGFTLTVNGPIQVSSYGQFNLSSGALAGTNVLTGTLTWSGGSIFGNMTVATNSALDIVSGGGDKIGGLVLTNDGTVNWTNTTIYSQGASNPQIYNYGLWNAQSDDSFQGGDGGGTTLFDNFGTFIKSGNTGTTVLDGNVVFNNMGTVTVESGTLDINGGGTSSGGNLTTSGAGILNFSNYSFVNTNTFTRSGIFVAGGASFEGTIIGTLSWDGGSVSGVLTVATNSVLNIVNGGGDTMDGLVLTNYGTVNWTNTTIYSQAPSNAQIYNYGLWNAQSDDSFQGGDGGGATLFDNFGTFIKSGNTGTTILDSRVVFNNTGTVTVESGTLAVSGGGTSSGGNLTTSGAGILNFSSYNFANTNTFTGSGSCVAGGATFAGAIIGTLSWDGGNVSGDLTVATNSVLDIVAGGGISTIEGLILTNYGTVNWANTTIYSQGTSNPQIYNYGLWNAQSDNTFQGGWGGGATLFDNFGTFVKSGNTGTTVLDGNVGFNNTGTVSADSGTLAIEGGGINSGSGTFTTANGGLLVLDGIFFANSVTISSSTIVDLGGNTSVNGVLSAPELQLVGGTLSGTNVLLGMLTWSGGSISGVLTVATNSVLNIVNGGGDTMDGLVLTNYGTINWTNTTIYSQVPSNAQIYNYGLWNAQSDDSFQGGDGGGATLFDNFGTFIKSGNTGTTILDSRVVFNNTGTVTVESGTLAVSGGGTSSGGNLTTSGAGILNFSSYNFANTNTFTGSGSCVAGGTSFEGTIIGTLSWDGGSVSGVLTVATNGVLNVANGGGDTMDGLVLTNYGSVNWTNTTIYSQAPSNAQIYNYGLWNAQSDDSFQGGDGGGATLFDNFGTFVKSGNTGTTMLDSRVVFNNTGTVTVESGTLAVSGGGTSSGGNFTTAGGAFLNFIGTVYDFANTNTFTGGGSSVAGGATFAGAIIGTLSWDGGNVSGVLTVATNSVLDIVAGGGISKIAGLALTNYGTVNWTNTTIYSQAPSNAQIYNYGLWNAQSDDSFQGGDGGGSTLFDNFGTFVKSGNTGTTMLDRNVLFNNTGTVQASSGTVSFGYAFIQNAGQTVLKGGNFAFSQVAQLLGGTLAGTGAITGSVSNNAVLGTGASPGLLAISGNFTEGANAHLAIKLGGTSAGTNYDQFSVGGSASLAGSLDLSYWNGFTPSATNVFTVLTGGVCTGAFSAVTSPGNDLDAVYTATNVLVLLHHPPPTVQLAMPAQALAGHTFAVAGSGTCLEGTVTNFALMVGSNVLFSTSGSSARVNYSCDFPGNLTITAIAMVNTGTQGQTNATVTIITLPVRTLDAIGFEANGAFKLLMLGSAGTNYQVLVSTNLAASDWTALGTMENTNGIWRCFDTAATNSPERFYRAKQLP